MDWFRRNWPDLLIGVALLAVVAGIVLTLLNGVSFLPFNFGGAEDAATSTSPVVSSPTPPSSNAPVVPSRPVVVPNTPPPPAQTTPTPPAETVVPVLPTLDPPQTAPQTTSPPPAPTRTQTPVGATASSGLAGASYRVVVGSFSVAANAEALAQKLRAEGYDTFTGKQGDLSLTLVGPFATRAEADRVEARLESSGQDAFVVYFDPENRGEPQPSTEASANSTSAATYLQVGAYANEESAMPQRQRLEELGYQVTERQSGSLVKLLIGPFDAQTLSQVRERLASLEIENFPTR